MKKALKVIGYALAGLILIVVLAALLIRFVFKEQMIAYVSKIEEKERIDLLRHATPYASDTVRYRFVYRQDTIQAQKIHAYFRLDTLLTDSSATTWDKTLTLATFVASHIPHANQNILKRVMPSTFGSIHARWNLPLIAACMPFCYMN